MSDAQPLPVMSVREFTLSLASHAPVPGGGSAAAMAGAMGAALLEMVVELSRGRAELAEHQTELDEIGAAAAARRDELLDLAQRDADAYEAVVDARRLPRDTDDERLLRAASVAEATHAATSVPLRTAEAAAEVLDLAARLAPLGNPHAVSDAGVAALLGVAALRGALLNVHINLPALAADDPLRDEVSERAGALEEAAGARGRAALDAVKERMGGAFA